MTDLPMRPTVDWAAPPEDPVDQLERQVVRGSHFTQAVFDKLVARLANTEVYLAELVDVLRTQGVLIEDFQADEDDEPDEYDGDQVQPGVQPEASAGDLAPDVEEDGPAPQAKVSWPGVAFRVDPEEPPPAVEVNCAERLPICHAVCCKLGFALTPPEVESGKVKWDLGFPYMVRHETNGYCSHNDTTTGCCSIYGDRPSVCRRYSCAGDTRIWKDFEAMELNEEWIREHLADRNRILLRTNLPIMEVNGKNGSPSA